MATHSSILAWEIPWLKESGRLQSMRSQEADVTERPNHHQWLDWEGGKFPWNPDEETEAQRGGMSCLKSHGLVGARLPLQGPSQGCMRLLHEKSPNRSSGGNVLPAERLEWAGWVVVAMLWTKATAYVTAEREDTGSRSREVGL